MHGEIVCVGEILWDLFPHGRFLGGAPLNVAFHLHSLGQPVTICSRIGNDELGHEIVARVREHGLDDSLLQRDRQLPTGRVNVTFLDPQTPQYEIERPAAWDAIAADDVLIARSAHAGAMVFGSLAQRAPVSRATIHMLWERVSYRVFDVNLRPPYDDRQVVERSLAHAELVKLNDGELEVLRQWLGLPLEECAAARALSGIASGATVCVTRAAAGAGLWHDGAWYDHAGYRVDAVDPVGAGDAFLAGLLTALGAGRAPSEALAHANAVGAYVATQPYATPPLDPSAIEALLTVTCYGGRRFADLSGRTRPPSCRPTA